MSEIINRKYTVNINTIDKIKDFANICQSASAEVCVYDDGGIEAAGSSIMGLFALNLLKPLKIKVKGKQEDIKSLTDKITRCDITIKE